jgi:hypothetical protein
MADSKFEHQRILQRFAAADFVLSELEKGHFPTLARFLGNARFNLRQITDTEAFREPSDQADLEKLVAASRLSGMVHVSMQPVPRLSLFYEQNLSEAEASLLSSSLQKVAAMVFAALGLDMSGLVGVEATAVQDEPSAERP